MKTKRQSQRKMYRTQRCV